MNTTFSSLLLFCLVSLGAAAQDVRERSDLALIQRQLTSLEYLANRERGGTTDSAEFRYRLDYPRLAADLKRVRQGIHNYLSPSRAQPADLVELAGDYRVNAPHSSLSNEHD